MEDLTLPEEALEITGTGKKPIPALLKRQCYFLDNFTCVYCGKRDFMVHVDHFIPEDLGGPTVIENLVTCCPSCNHRKGSKGCYEVGLYPRYGRYLYNPPQSQTIVRPPSTKTSHMTVNKFPRRILEEDDEFSSDTQIAQIKALLLEGKRNSEIAELLGVSIRTIQYRLKNYRAVVMDR